MTTIILPIIASTYAPTNLITTPAKTRTAARPPDDLHLGQRSHVDRADGAILVAYLFAIPANEIVIPTVLMLTVLVTGVSGVGSGAGVMFQLDNAGTLNLLQAGGRALLTAVNLMLCSLIHNPCSTTLSTIFKETDSRRRMALIRLAMGLAVTFFVAQVCRLNCRGGVSRDLRSAPFFH